MNKNILVRSAIALGLLLSLGVLSACGSSTNSTQTEAVRQLLLNQNKASLQNPGEWCASMVNWSEPYVKVGKDGNLEVVPSNVDKRIAEDVAACITGTSASGWGQALSAKTKKAIQDEGDQIRKAKITISSDGNVATLKGINTYYPDSGTVENSTITVLKVNGKWLVDMSGKKNTQSDNPLEAAQVKQFLIANLNAMLDRDAKIMCQSTSIVSVDTDGNLAQLPDNLDQELAKEKAQCIQESKDRDTGSSAEKAQAQKDMKSIEEQINSAKVSISPDGNVATIKGIKYKNLETGKEDVINFRVLQVQNKLYRDVGPDDSF